MPLRSLLELAQTDHGVLSWAGRRGAFSRPSAAECLPPSIFPLLLAGCEEEEMVVLMVAVLALHSAKHLVGILCSQRQCPFSLGKENSWKRAFLFRAKWEVYTRRDHSTVQGPRDSARGLPLGVEVIWDIVACGTSDRGLTGPWLDGGAPITQGGGFWVSQGWGSPRGQNYELLLSWN